MAGEVALDQPGSVASAFSFGDPFGDVVLGCRVVLAAVQDDGVQGAVELPVAAAAESVPCRLAAGGGDRGDASEASESGLGAQPAAMRPGDDQLRGDDRADAWLVEQRGRECAYMGEDLPFQLGRFAGCCIDSASEASQDEPCRELIGSCRARAAKAATALEQPTGREHAQLLAEPVRGGDDHAAKLSERFASHVDGASTCDE